MPWHWKPKKDVTSCEKLRAGAHIRQSADIRMRELTCGNAQVSLTEHIGQTRETRRTETSKYPEEKKEKSIPLVVASEEGTGQTECLRTFGVAGSS